MENLHIVYFKITIIFVKYTSINLGWGEWQDRDLQLDEGTG